MPPPFSTGKTPLRVNGGAQELLRCRGTDLGLRGHAEAVRQPRTALAEASGGAGVAWEISSENETN